MLRKKKQTKRGEREKRKTNAGWYWIGKWKRPKESLKEEEEEDEEEEEKKEGEEEEEEYEEVDMRQVATETAKKMFGSKSTHLYS